MKKPNKTSQIHVGRTTFVTESFNPVIRESTIEIDDEFGFPSGSATYVEASTIFARMEVAWRKKKRNHPKEGDTFRYQFNQDSGNELFAVNAVSPAKAQWVTVGNVKKRRLFVDFEAIKLYGV